MIRRAAVFTAGDGDGRARVVPSSPQQVGFQFQLIAVVPCSRLFVSVPEERETETDREWRRLFAVYRWTIY